MKINDSKKFGFGLILIILSYVPFSYVNHADKFKIENCERISGTITTVEKSYGTRGTGQVGWMIKLEEFDYKIRIIGGYYNAIHHDKFKRLIETGTIIEVYMLKPEFNGMFENWSNNLGVKDATTIICSEEEVLDLKSIRDRLRHLFIMNLIFGITAVGYGINMIIKSMKTNTIKGYKA